MASKRCMFGLGKSLNPAWHQHLACCPDRVILALLQEHSAGNGSPSSGREHLAGPC